MTGALQTIRFEHHNIYRVLACLRDHVRRTGADAEPPDHELLAAIVCYLQEFPDAVHHPKEERHLFTPLVTRRPEALPLIEALCNEHADGLRLLADLEAAIQADLADPAAVERLRVAADAYVDFQLAHMRREETEVFPLALAALTAADWGAADAAFANNRDPLFGADRERRFRALYRRILDLAPHPGGTDATHS